MGSTEGLTAVSTLPYSLLPPHHPTPTSVRDVYSLSRIHSSYVITLLKAQVLISMKFGTPIDNTGRYIFVISLCHVAKMPGIFLCILWELSCGWLIRQPGTHMDDLISRLIKTRRFGSRQYKYMRIVGRLSGANQSGITDHCEHYTFQRRCYGQICPKVSQLPRCQ